MSSARISSERSHAPTARDYPRCLSRGARVKRNGGRRDVTGGGGEGRSLLPGNEGEKRVLRVVRAVRARTEVVIDAHRKLAVGARVVVVKESPRGPERARVER